ncbi:MAG: DUF4406 domain-containing protein [Clostridiales bacterium]
MDNVLESIQEKIKELIEVFNCKQERKVAYIAGPMTSDPNYKSKFDLAEGILKSAGYIVYNPAWQPQGLKYEEYMAVSGKMLDCCNHIFLLDGWEKSPGVKTELKKAIENNMEIHDFLRWHESQGAERQI